jgi:hypothetical protein
MPNYTLSDFVRCRNQTEWVCDNCGKCGDKSCCEGDQVMYRVPRTDHCLCSTCLDDSHIHGHVSVRPSVVGNGPVPYRRDRIGV